MIIEFQGFRGFENRQKVSLKPLTILVGENSSGKTSFLALVSSVLSKESYPFQLSTEEEPYRMFGYKSIATKNLQGNVDKIYVSLKYEANSITSKYIDDNGVPGPKQIEISSKNGRCVLLYGEKFISFSIMTNNNSYRGKLIRRKTGEDYDINELFFHICMKIEEKNKLTENESFSNVYEVMRKPLAGLPISRSISPIRSKLQKVYHFTHRTMTKDGAYVPLLLSEIKSEGNDDVFEFIRDFGKKSRLFDDIEIKSLGGKYDPFEVLFKMGHNTVNAVDVGYGVGQLLPLLVELIVMPSNAYIIMQQPEVHLHPRAQAEFGSLLAKTVKQNKKIVLETHSDYIIDRIRREIRDGIINSNDVGLLYFERSESGCNTYEIGLDDQGNVIDPPNGYREFFLNEQMDNLFGPLEEQVF